MGRYVVDAWIWVEYFEGDNPKIKDILENEHNEIYTNLVTVSEIVSLAKRKNKNIDEIFRALTSVSKIFESNLLFYKEVGILHAEIKEKIKDFGLADAFVLATARMLKAKVLTGDLHFKRFKEAIFIQ